MTAKTMCVHVTNEMKSKDILTNEYMVYMFVCVHVCDCVSACLHVCVCARVWAHTYARMHIVCVCVCVRACVSVGAHAHVCVHIL